MEEKKKLEVILFGVEPMRYIEHEDDFWYLWQDMSRVMQLNDKDLEKLPTDMMRPFSTELLDNALFVNEWCTGSLIYRRRRPIFTDWCSWSGYIMMKHNREKRQAQAHEQREAYFESKVTDVIKEHFKGVENVSYEWLYVFQSNMFTLFDAFDELLHEHGIDMSLAEVIKAKRESLKNK